MMINLCFDFTVHFCVHTVILRNMQWNNVSLLISASFIAFVTISFALFYLFSRNEDSNINRSRLLLNGFIGQAMSNKYEDFTESFWGPRDSIENQTRQHYLTRSRYIADQSLRLPYPSVYGTQSISKCFFFFFDTCVCIQVWDWRIDKLRERREQHRNWKHIVHYI